MTLDGYSSIHEMKIVYASIRDYSGNTVFESFFNQEGVSDFNPSIIDGQFTTLRLSCNCTLSGFYNVKISFENGSSLGSRFNGNLTKFSLQASLLCLTTLSFVCVDKVI